MLQRLLDRNVRATLAERDHEFDLEMQVVGQRRIGKGLARQNHVVGILLEEERRLLVGIAAHLDSVGGIVAPDAVDAPDREASLGSAYRQRRDGRRSHDIGRQRVVHGVHRQGLDLSWKNAGAPRGARLAETGIRGGPLSTEATAHQTVFRRAQGLFSAFTAFSIISGGDEATRLIRASNFSPVTGSTSMPSLAASAKNSGSLNVAKKLSRNAARRSAGMSGGAKNGRPKTCSAIRNSSTRRCSSVFTHFQIIGTPIFSSAG